MDRFPEFEEIILNHHNNYSKEEDTNNSSETSLRNRFETKNEKEEPTLLKISASFATKDEENIYNFSKSFLTECILIVSLV